MFYTILYTDFYIFIRNIDISFYETRISYITIEYKFDMRR